MKFLLVVILLIPNIFASVIDFTEKTGWGGDCPAGKRQSPINFPSNYNYTVSNYFEILSTEYKTISELQFAKTPIDDKKYHIVNLTQDYGYLMVRKNGVTYRYDLLDVHFHILAEHTFDGKAYETEMHMVHTKNLTYLAANNITDTDEDKVNQYLVVGTVFQVDGTTDNVEFDRMNLGKGVNINSLNLRQFSRPDQSYYHYIGGLTTPDCNQVVNWVVNTTPVKISAKQNTDVRQWITALYPNGNTRVVQALNDRTIYKIDKTIVLPSANTSAGFLNGNMMIISALIAALLF